MDTEISMIKVTPRSICSPIPYIIQFHAYYIIWNKNRVRRDEVSEPCVDKTLLNDKKKLSNIDRNSF